MILNIVPICQKCDAQATTRKAHFEIQHPRACETLAVTGYWGLWQFAGRAERRLRVRGTLTPTRKKKWRAHLITIKSRREKISLLAAQAHNFFGRSRCLYIRSRHPRGTASKHRSDPRGRHGFF